MTKDYRLDVESAHYRLTPSPTTIWLSASFSESWWRDAVREAEGVDEHATRREIVFSICFLESYIFEWTRDLGIDNVDICFPLGSSRSLKDKWKNVPIKLFAEGTISAKPDLDLSELGVLLSYRNGLVHARASRPSTEGLSNKAKPIPAVGELREVEHGWAIDIAENLVKKLHQDIGTPCPEYIH